MTLNDLIAKINQGRYKTIEVERLRLRTGNTDNSGNDNTVKLKLGSDVGSEQIEFNNSTGTWAHTP
jgi:hypothetical protein